MHDRECGVRMKDIRTLCGQHAQEMRDAGYWLVRTGKEFKCECDKCYKQGFEYELKIRR